MSFPTDAFYLVEPLPSLAERLRGWADPAMADILLQSRLFRRQEGGNSDWLYADREATVKLLFLASLREYDPLQSGGGFAAVFGSAAVSVGVFDRWFRVRRLEVDDELPWMEPWLRDCPLPVEPTGRPLADRWLERVRRPADAAPDRPHPQRGRR